MCDLANVPTTRDLRLTNLKPAIHNIALSNVGSGRRRHNAPTSPFARGEFRAIAEGSGARGGA
jgi:hypothetical protein